VCDIFIDVQHILSAGLHELEEKRCHGYDRQGSNLLAEALPEETSAPERGSRRVSRIKAADESPTARACQERIVRRFLRVLGQNGKT